MTEKVLAQINIARLAYAEDAAEVAEFINALDRINALADNSDGFIWRLVSDTGGLVPGALFGDGMLVNMSVWRDRDSLFNYVYTSEHAAFFAKRKQWFLPSEPPYQALWWIERGHIPTLIEAKQRLDHLKEHGPDAYAFTFKKNFPAE